VTTRGNDIHNIVITSQSHDLLSIRVPAPTPNRIQGGLTQLQSFNYHPTKLMSFENRCQSISDESYDDDGYVKLKEKARTMNTSGIHSKRNNMIGISHSNNSTRKTALALPQHRRFSFISTCKTKIQFKNI